RRLGWVPAKGGLVPNAVPPPARRVRFALLALTGALLLGAPATAGAQVVTQIAADPFTNPSSQHKTIVEPDTFSFGSSIVVAAQSGRFFDGGSSGVAFATTTNNGASWTSGVLPGVTKYTGGIYDRVSDAAVAYDA